MKTQSNTKFKMAVVDFYSGDWKKVQNVLEEKKHLSPLNFGTVANRKFIRNVLTKVATSYDERLEDDKKSRKAYLKRFELQKKLQKMRKDKEKKSDEKKV